jgi:hypothetical protein
LPSAAAREGGFLAALPSAPKAHLFRLEPLLAAAFSAAACASGANRSICLSLAGFSGTGPSWAQAVCFEHDDVVLRGQKIAAKLPQSRL